VGRLHAIYGPVIALAIAANAGLPLAGSLGCTAAGLALWTLLEYGIHRYAFHGFMPHSDHHEEPKDVKYIIAPIWLSGGTSLALWVLIRIPAGSWARSGLTVAAIIAGYLAYEAVHLRIHSDAAGGKWLTMLRKRHYFHHFADERFCYGVTSPLWDRVFGSLPS
jgi:sterol desaturase/sphingolipid hydroxylase (fatty acid hydroxylase superfamily)